MAVRPKRTSRRDRIRHVDPRAPRQADVDDGAFDRWTSSIRAGCPRGRRASSTSRMQSDGVGESASQPQGGDDYLAIRLAPSLEVSTP